MSIMEFKAGRTVAPAQGSSVESHDFKIIAAYAILAVAIFVAFYAIFATPDGYAVDFSALSMSP